MLPRRAMPGIPALKTAHAQAHHRALHCGGCFGINHNFPF